MFDTPLAHSPTGAVKIVGSRRAAAKMPFRNISTSNSTAPQPLGSSVIRWPCCSEQAEW
jgi:hypothetical protein